MSYSDLDSRVLSGIRDELASINRNLHSIAESLKQKEIIYGPEFPANIDTENCIESLTNRKDWR